MALATVNVKETGSANVNQMISHLSDKGNQRYSQKIYILGFDSYLLPNLRCPSGDMGEYLLIRAHAIIIRVLASH